MGNRQMVNAEQQMANGRIKVHKGGGSKAGWKSGVGYKNLNFHAGKEKRKEATGAELAKLRNAGIKMRCTSDLSS